MKERRYKEDWQLRTEMDAKGREKQVPVYVGPRFRADRAPRALRRERVLRLVSGMVCAALLLLYLQLGTGSTRVIYVLPIALCALIPAAYWIIGAVSCLRCPPEGMTSVQKENGPGRVLRASAAVWIILAAALLGDLIYCSSQSAFAAEWPGLALLICAFTAALAQFARARDSYRHIVMTDPGQPRPPKPSRKPKK